MKKADLLFLSEMSTKKFVLGNSNDLYLKGGISKSILNRETVKFHGGSVVELNSYLGKETRPRKTEAEISTENREFYLRIRCGAKINKVDFCEILNDEEVSKIRGEEDDLLNIYIPLAILDEKKSFKAAPNLINTPIIWTRRHYRTPLEVFYENGFFNHSGFILSSVDNLIIDVFKDGELPVDGDVLAIELSGNIKTSSYLDGNQVERFYDNFYLNSFSLKTVSKSQIKIKPFEYTEQVGSKLHPEIPIDFIYPIGEVKDGNYTYFEEGNVQIKLGRNEYEYFKNIEMGEDDCPTAVYEKKIFRWGYVSLS